MNSDQDTPEVVVASEIPLPEDLYVPPGGLEVLTQVFEGPLDVLLYLVRKNKFDILDLPVAEIAGQYARFIDLMESIQMDIAGEYLAMAATLAKMKSRQLLPKPEEEADDEDIDPRFELAARLLEYERIQKLSEWLEDQPRVGRELFLIECEGVEIPMEDRRSTVSMSDLIQSFKNVIALAANEQSIILGRETLSVKERVYTILNALRKSSGHLRFQDLYDIEEGKQGMVVSLLALLELVDSNVAYAVQVNANSQIHVHLNK